MYENDHSTIRLTCACRHPSCGLRRVELPFAVFQRAHGVECDRCGLLMTCVACLAGDSDPRVIWFDVKKTQLVA